MRERAGRCERHGRHHRLRLLLQPVGLLCRRGPPPPPLVGAGSSAPWSPAPHHAGVASCCIAGATKSPGLSDAAAAGLQPGKAGSRAPRPSTPPHPCVVASAGDHAAQSPVLSFSVPEQETAATTATSFNGAPSIPPLPGTAMASPLPCVRTKSTLDGDPSLLRETRGVTSPLRSLSR